MLRAGDYAEDLRGAARAERAACVEIALLAAMEMPEGSTLRQVALDIADAILARGVQR